MSTSRHNSEKVYAVLGGDMPGVYDHAPFLAGSPSSPILPIVIKCTSHAEANAAFGLQAVFTHLKGETAEAEPETFAKAIARSSQITDLFATSGPFYAVYKGRQRAIYVRNYSDVQAQVHGFAYPKFRRFDSIKQALVFMILRGDEGKTEDICRRPQHSEDSSRRRGVDMEAGSTGEMSREQIHEGQRSRPIFSHIRDLTGIIDTIYGSTSGPPEYLSYALGKHASYYLQAHGYTDTTIEKIQDIWQHSSNVDKFVELLSPYGMATTEIRWLWDMIRHNGDCGS